MNLHSSPMSQEKNTTPAVESPEVASRTKVFAVRDVLVGRMQELFERTQTPEEEVQALEELIGSFTPDSFILTGVLESAGDRMSVEALRIALTHEDEYIRTFAFTTLLERPDVDARQDMEYVLQHAAAGEMNYAYALDASRRYNDKEATDLVLEQTKKGISEELIFALRAKHGKEVQNALLSIAEFNTGRIKLLALQALYPFETPEVDSLLLATLKNPTNTAGQIGALLALRARDHLSQELFDAVVELSWEDLEEDVSRAVSDTLFAHRKMDGALEALQYIATSDTPFRDGKETPAGYARRYLQK